MTKNWDSRDLAIMSEARSAMSEKDVCEYQKKTLYAIGAFEDVAPNQLFQSPHASIQAQKMDCSGKDTTPGSGGDSFCTVL